MKFETDAPSSLGLKSNAAASDGRKVSQESLPSANLIAQEIIDTLDKSIPPRAFNDMRLFALKTIESFKTDGMTGADQEAGIRKIINSIHASRPQILLSLSDDRIIGLYDALADYKACFAKRTRITDIAEQIGRHDEMLFFDTGRTPSLKVASGKKDIVLKARRVAEKELNSILPKGSYLNDLRVELIEKTLKDGASVKDWLARKEEIEKERVEAQASVLKASGALTKTFRPGGKPEDTHSAKLQLAAARDRLDEWRPNHHHYKRICAKQSLNAVLQSARTRLARERAPRKMTRDDIQTIGRLISAYKEVSDVTGQGVSRALLDAAVHKPPHPGPDEHQHSSNAIAQQVSAGTSSPGSGQLRGIKRSSTSENLSNSPGPKKKPLKFVRDAATDKGQERVTNYFSRQIEAVPAGASLSGTVDPDSMVAGNSRGERSAPKHAEPGANSSHQSDHGHRELALEQRERSRSRSLEL